ncbi:MAG: hypothetical protein CM1200mP26_26710 [Acidimicrobiales bacterium]|nr:MAG: hypothetical protein CM1200mP26_26710 [Acidimicrobiales bacterium]
MRDLARRGSLDAALSEAGVADRVEILQMDVTDRASIAEAFARADRWVQLAGDVGRIVGPGQQRGGWRRLARSRSCHRPRWAGS